MRSGYSLEEINRLLQNSLPNARFQALSGSQINITAKYRLKLILQGEKFKKSNRVVELDKQIDVAFCRCLRPSDRTEQHEGANAEALRQHWLVFT